MPFVIYYSLKEKSLISLQDKNELNKGHFCVHEHILITITISIQTTGEKWAEFWPADKKSLKLLKMKCDVQSLGKIAHCR